MPGREGGQQQWCNPHANAKRSIIPARCFGLPLRIPGAKGAPENTLDEFLDSSQDDSPHDTFPRAPRQGTGQWCSALQQKFAILLLTSAMVRMIPTHLFFRYAEFISCCASKRWVQSASKCILAPSHHRVIIAQKGIVECEIGANVQGTWTPLHADVMRSYSWSTNVAGRKRWLLLPPCHTHLLYDRFGQHMAPDFSPRTDAGMLKHDCQAEQRPFTYTL